MVSEAVSEYLAQIGRKGGKAGKGTQWRSEVCRHAAKTRWRAYRERKKAEALKAEALRKQLREERDRILEAAKEKMAVGLVEDLAAEEVRNEAADIEPPPVIPKQLLA